jgi:hypothetical protein
MSISGGSAKVTGKNEACSASAKKSIFLKHGTLLCHDKHLRDVKLGPCRGKIRK